MRIFLLVLYVILIGSKVSAQTSAVQFFQDNTLYLNTDNPLTIVADGYPCKSLIVSINNGTIKGKDGQYIAHPDSINYNTIITIKAKTPKGVKELSQQHFRIKHLPGQVPGEVDSTIKK